MSRRQLWGEILAYNQFFKIFTENGLSSSSEICKFHFYDRLSTYIHEFPTEEDLRTEFNSEEQMFITSFASYLKIQIVFEPKATNEKVDSAEI